ncbi:MAG: histidine kinase [Mariprofundales bacterium]
MYKTQQECFALLEHERRILANELHDEIGQYLTAIRTTAALIKRQSEGRCTYDTTTTLLDLITQLDVSLRRLLQRLWPTALENIGLEAALEDLAIFSKRYTTCKTVIQWNVPSSCKMSDDIKLAIYRIVQESITNAITHGNASKVIANINLQLMSADNKLIHIQVCDNGCGINYKPDNETDNETDNNTKNPLGIGRLGIKKRIEALGGTFSIDSINANMADKIDSQTGLCLQASIPLYAF